MITCWDPVRVLHQSFVESCIIEKVALFIYFTLLWLQLISGNQERFVQMLNEPDSTETGRQGSGGQEQEAGGGSPGFIQVTPQEKEAIERVTCLSPPPPPSSTLSLSLFHSLLWIAWGDCCSDHSLLPITAHASLLCSWRRVSGAEQNHLLLKAKMSVIDQGRDSVWIAIMC